MKMLSYARPRWSILIFEPASRNNPVYFGLVKWPPWSLFIIVGWVLPSALLLASRTKEISKVSSISQDSTYLEYQSMWRPDIASFSEWEYTWYQYSIYDPGNWRLPISADMGRSDFQAASYWCSALGKWPESPYPACVSVPYFDPLGSRNRNRARRQYAGVQTRDVSYRWCQWAGLTVDPIGMTDVVYSTGRNGWGSAYPPVGIPKNRNHKSQP